MSDKDNGHVLLGAALILIGLAFMADRVDWLEFEFSPHAWPYVPLALGMLRLLWPHRRAAVWLLGIGLYGLVSEYGWFGLHYGSSWPLLIIVAGINMVWRALEQPQPPKAIREN